MSINNNHHNFQILNFERKKKRNDKNHIMLKLKCMG